jgi:hypothetical protein
MATKDTPIYSIWYLNLFGRQVQAQRDRVAEKETNRKRAWEATELLQPRYADYRHLNRPTKAALYRLRPYVVLEDSRRDSERLAKSAILSYHARDSKACLATHHSIVDGAARARAARYPRVVR